MTPKIKSRKFKNALRVIKTNTRGNNINKSTEEESVLKLGSCESSQVPRQVKWIRISKNIQVWKPEGHMLPWTQLFQRSNRPLSYEVETRLCLSQQRMAGSRWGEEFEKADLFSSVQFSHSVMSNSCDPMDCSTPGLPVHHEIPELTQTHIH